MTDSAREILRETLPAARAGDRWAFDRLALAFRPEIVAFCLRFLGRREDAEDVAQEVFSHAWQHLATFRGDAAFRTWLWEIARNRCLNHLRARKSLLNQRTQSVEAMGHAERQETFELPDTQPTPEKTAVDAAEMAQIREEIRQIAAEKRWETTDWELFTLRVEQEIAYADFALRHGRDEAYWRNRWRDKIKPVLERVKKRMESLAA